MKIRNFVEIPKMNQWINAGYTIIPKDLLKLFPKSGDVETAVYPKLVQTDELYAFLINDGYNWKAIDTHKDLKEINE